nr:hypothetical protein [Xanthobacter dioxanivorans]
MDAHRHRGDRLHDLRDQSFHLARRCDADGVGDPHLHRSRLRRPHRHPDHVVGIDLAVERAPEGGGDGDMGPATRVPPQLQDVDAGGQGLLGRHTLVFETEAVRGRAHGADFVEAGLKGP